MAEGPLKNQRTFPAGVTAQTRPEEVPASTNPECRPALNPGASELFPGEPEGGDHGRGCEGRAVQAQPKS